MPVLVRYTPKNLTREQYDKVNETLVSNAPAESNGPPADLYMHVFFGEEGSLLVSEVWESEASWREMYDNALLPALDQVGVEHGGMQVIPIESIMGSKYTG